MLKKSDSKQALPVTLLDELRSEEIKKRINAVTQLKTIAHALGPDRTRLELIPFLNGTITPKQEFIDDEEEVLKILIGNLKDFATFIGGEANEKCMLPLLISLCKSDEKVPSEMAAEAILTILKRMDPKKNEELVLEVLKKLIDSESLRGK
jgi:serine/threonine-protein phosphatase 2A regulatory subunit A